MQTHFYLNLLVLLFQRLVKEIDCDIFSQLFLLAGHTFTSVVICYSHFFSLVHFQHCVAFVLVIKSFLCRLSWEKFWPSQMWE